MKKTLLALASMTLSLGTSPADAQAGPHLGLAAHVGTLGIGLDAALALHSRVGVRVGANFFPTTFDATASQVSYTIDMQSPTFTGMVDLYLAGPIRLSGGVMYASNNITLEGGATGSIEVGGITYPGSDVGTLRGEIVTRKLSSYLGLGIGNPAASKFGFFLDIGAGFHGTPAFALTADGILAGDPTFQANLEAERLEIEDDLSQLKIYPVVSIGMSLRIF
jgi:hypothetical protein